ncbi:MAG: electron transfer flavoprotein subunit beta/FixA family protein [Coriobacteriales bacterium]|jgi:electron transfer flavoprotein beta subunit|nr:electron transfer flavoprotein subunit beta/FixA family protein [Coriobacteriales bacterium]
MSKYVVCYKWVLDEADIRILDDLSIDTSRVKGKVSDFDRNAIEAAMRTAEKTGVTVLSLTFGDNEVHRSLKDVLSRGPAEGYWIGDAAAATADGRVSAHVLAKGIEAIGDVSLVFCAEGASDTYARQVPGRIASLLDWPLVSSVLSVEVEGEALTAVRKLDDCLQTVEVTLPAVVSVLPEDFEPKVPSLKAVMAGGRKPSHELPCVSLGVDLRPRRDEASLQGFVTSRKNIIHKELGVEEAVRQTVAALRKEGVVS